MFVRCPDCGAARNAELHWSKTEEGVQITYDAPPCRCPTSTSPSETKGEDA